MKVAELKAGMLLRFKEERIYKFLHDGKSLDWLDFSKVDPRKRLYNFKMGRPLMIYLGQEHYPSGTYYGSFKKIRKVSVEGRIAAVFPDAWKDVEAI
jgi:hypothetical protein